MFSELFDNQKPFWKFLSKLFDVVLLNLYWILFSIPIITIGASTTAVYAACFQIVLEGSESVFRVFRRSWKENWKQSTALFFLLAVLTAFLGFDLWYFFFAQQYLTGFPKSIICGIITLLLMSVLLIGIYGYAMLSLFENTLRGTVQNALILALRHPIRSISMLVLDLGLLIGTVLSLYYFPMVSMLLLLFGAAIGIFFHVVLIFPVVERFLPEAEKEGAE